MTLWAFAVFPKAFCPHRGSLQPRLPVLVTISSVQSHASLTSAMTESISLFCPYLLCKNFSSCKAFCCPLSCCTGCEEISVAHHRLQRLWLSLLFHWHYVCPWDSLSLENIHGRSGQHAFPPCQIQQGLHGFCSRWAAHVKKHIRSLLCLLQCLGWAMQL